MTQDQMRAEFEAWAATLDMDLAKVEYELHWEYSDCNTDYAWLAWQAAFRPQSAISDEQILERAEKHSIGVYDDGKLEVYLTRGTDIAHCIIPFARALLSHSAGQADGWRHALHAAVAALYFDDSSDFRSALGSVVRHLDPDFAFELLCSPKVAYDKACAMIAAAPDVSTPSTDGLNMSTKPQNVDISQADGWISVETRMPEPGLYLVNSSWGVRPAYKHDPQWADGFQDAINKADEGTTDFDGKFKGVFRVTHWMPMRPAPSKEES